MMERSFNSDDWEKARLLQLQNERREKLQREVLEEEEKRLALVDSLREESVELVRVCSGEIDPTDRWQYRKGLRLMYIGTMIGDLSMKGQGREFVEKCNNKG